MNLLTFFGSLTPGDYFQTPDNGQWYMKTDVMVTRERMPINAVCLTTGTSRYLRPKDMVVHLENMTFEAESTIF